MQIIRRRKFSKAVWIPLRARQHLRKSGERGRQGFVSDFFGAGSLASPIGNQEEATALEWRDIGIGLNHFGCVEDGDYIPADTYHAHDTSLSGIHLVLDQHLSGVENDEWHLHQDLVIALGLKREADRWLRPDEGYAEVARLSRDEEGAPGLLAIRASHLRDYLCAREMGLCISSYRQRLAILHDTSQITWPGGNSLASKDNCRWQGRVTEIHEGGMPYGEQTFVTHVARTDVDTEEDVPSFDGIPSDDGVTSNSWTIEDTGQKLFRVEGELWGTEWVEPSTRSPIVRADDVPPRVYFYTEGSGKQEDKTSLEGGGRWLWFRPEVICSLAHRRGGTLNWYTRETGEVGCSPNGRVHFGLNSLGLVTVYAKDIVLLDEWEQRIWSGHNVHPDGGVSQELLASQVHAEPADTQAPEAFLEYSIVRLGHTAKEKLGISLFQENDQIPSLVARTHRFRATDREGLYALAKDLARLTADCISTKALHSLVPPPKNEKWGSLKSLERVLATKIPPGTAREVLGPLVGTYELRNADAHLSSQQHTEALRLVNISEGAPYITQGYQLIHSCVSALCTISEVIESRFDSR